MDTKNDLPARLRGLRLVLGRHNKPISGREFARLAHMSPGTLRALESGTRQLNPDDRSQIARWIGAEWDDQGQRWVYTDDHKIPFSRQLFELYSAVKFEHPHARDVDTHMAALALIHLLQALPHESYRRSLFLLHDRLEELAKEFAPEISSTLEKLHPKLKAFRDIKTGTIAFSNVDHPKCKGVPGSDVLGPNGQDLILNFHDLRLAQTFKKKSHA